MELEEYRAQVQKKHTQKQAKVRGSWGVYDIYKHIRRSGWSGIDTPLTEHDFYTIIRSVNTMLADNISKGVVVVFPERMGKLELRKQQRGVGIVDGKLKITYPVDWGETVRLWYEDEESRRNKTLLRNESKEVYQIKYDKYPANYENKLFYEFCVNRNIKKALKCNIQQGKIETLW